MSGLHKLLPVAAALALALAGVVIAPQSASADQMFGNCNVVANPTQDHHSECAGADLGPVIFPSIDFDWADLAGATMGQLSNVSYSTFRHADLSNGTWSHVGLVGADFTDANLDGVNLYDSVAPGANFSGASLRGANLTSGSLTGSSFTGADLTNADFSNVNLTANADPDDFTDATLTGANFTGTALMPASPAPVQATSAAGAPVTWAAPAKTDPGAQLGDCSAPGLGIVHSGDTFPIGATTVTCQFVSTTNGTSGTGQFTVTVNAPADSVAITSVASATFNAGANGTFTVTTTGYPAATIQEQGALPAGVGFTDNGDGTATLSGAPQAGTGGTYQLQFTATAGTATDGQTFTLTVDEAPAITSGASATFVVGAEGSFTVTATGFPAPSMTEDGALPSGVTFAGGVLSGTPDPGTGGTYSVTLTASNGVGDDATQGFTLTVNEGPAITSADSATFTVGDSGSFTVTSSGVPDAGISENGALPGGVTFVDNGDGTATLSGTPEAGAGGAYPLTLTASNGVGDDATQDFTLTVDEAPAITSSDTAVLTIGVDRTVTVTTGGFPAPTITVSGQLPEGLTVTDNGDGTATFSGRPAAGTSGAYVLTITADNGVGQSVTQTFTLTAVTADTTTTLAASDNPVTAGASLTLTATVDPPAGAPTGTVQFLDGDVVLGSARLVANDATSSVAALTITAPSAGTHSIVAVYGGDGAYAGSTSASLSLTVIAAAATPESPGTTPSELPDTGVDVRPLLSVSFALLLSGGLALTLARRRRRA